MANTDGLLKFTATVGGQNIGAGEKSMIAVLTRIVLETMDYSPARRDDSDSFLPALLIEDAQQVLSEYGVRVQPDMAMKVCEVHHG
jgi:hypothetical protein